MFMLVEKPVVISHVFETSAELEREIWNGPVTKHTVRIEKENCSSLGFQIVFVEWLLIFLGDPAQCKCRDDESKVLPGTLPILVSVESPWGCSTAGIWGSRTLKGSQLTNVVAKCPLTQHGARGAGRGEGRGRQWWPCNRVGDVLR